MFEISVASTTMNVAQSVACVTTAPGTRSPGGFARKIRNVTNGIGATEAVEIHAVRRGSLGTSAARPSSTALRISSTSWSDRQESGIVHAITL